MTKENKAADFLWMNLGVLLLSIGVYFFKIPNGFSPGGVSGIGTILGKITPNVSASVWIMIINILLLFVGFFVLGKGTGGKTVYCSIMFSLLTLLFEKFIPLSHPLSNQPFLELCYAMLLTAFGSALMFDKGASSGGTDIVALILKKYTSINVGKALLAVDSLIAVSSFFVFDIQTGLFSLLGLFAKAFLVDSIIESINSFKYFVVITEKGDEVSEYIIKTLHHGVTVNEAEGAFTHSKKYMIHTVCRRIEAIRLKKEIKKIDEHAFVIITTTSEIVGRGFRSV
ncbi:MAG: YitT family protein [Clostridia bacterium]|nr:YitT family protein [Clostridia bacterium]